VRRRFEERFSVTRITNDYVDVYRALLGKSVHRTRIGEEVSGPVGRVQSDTDDRMTRVD
jgi:hypothetical protein